MKKSAHYLKLPTKNKRNRKKKLRKKMLSMFYFILAPIVFNIVTARNLQHLRSVTGYAYGYLSDCPGNENPIIMSEDSLRKLRIKVIGAKMTSGWIKKKYNYYQMNEMGNDPTMDYSRKTVLFISGYFDNPDFAASRIMEYSYRLLGYNVFLLDMHKFVEHDYPSVTRNLPAIGKHTAEMLYNLTQQNVGFDPKKFEMVGLSLGGETISFIAKSYKALSGVKISRLTALDPSGPCFRNRGPDRRLDKSDADYVEVIGTNIDGLGIATPVGHVNIYINGGEYQMSDIYWMPCEMFCSHIKVFEIWFSALRNQDSFIAIQCDTMQQARDKDCYDRKPFVTNLLGLKVDKTKHGIFYLATTYNYPYYMGEKGLKRENEPVHNLLKATNKADIVVV
ncbi:lipase member H-A-like [Galleria mellonella]|uniref:Lipase member H-A-like n=1 Tax=Galleria mellonella TaxID=7137 RepID=A0A6J1X7R2_GALME|nr:lipase member H-A-like [Galleria mellonella]